MSASRAGTSGPMMNCWRSMTDISAGRTASLVDWYCAVRSSNGTRTALSKAEIRANYYSHETYLTRSAVSTLRITWPQGPNARRPRLNCATSGLSGLWGLGALGRCTQELRGVVHPSVRDDEHDFPGV